MALEAEGFAVRCYSDGAEALKGMTAQPVDLAVLDIKMPRMDGMELLGQLRRQSHIPVIFLTSKDDEVDELLGLRMGADDYIRKPFSQRLLIERIRALIRRGELAREREDSQAEPVIVRGQMTLDPARHQCTWKSEPVELTVTEFLILKSLADGIAADPADHRGQCAASAAAGGRLFVSRQIRSEPDRAADRVIAHPGRDLRRRAERGRGPGFGR